MNLRLLSVLGASLALASVLFAGPRDKQWKEVEDAVRHHLPDTAIQRLEPIAAAAIAEGAYAEAVNAIARKIALQSEKEGGTQRIVALQAAIDRAPVPMRPMMEAILAHWYWDYFVQNRWRIDRRTATDSAPGPDPATWDAARLFAEIDRHYTAALAADAAIKAVPISDYQGLLERGTVPDLYRPTLYDFLAGEALDFYASGEQAAQAREDEFEVADSDPILADRAVFMNWRPSTADRTSPKYKAIALYQALLRFHEHDANPAALLDADLARIVYGHSIAEGDRKDERYKSALQRLIAGTDNHEILSRAFAALAQQLKDEDDLVQARSVAQRCLDHYLSGSGATACHNLIAEIEAPSLRIATESVWNAPWPKIAVTYRNVSTLYFRAVPLDYRRTLMPGTSEWSLDGLENRPPTLAWNTSLPDASDFHEHTVQLPAPASLPPGFYAIVASPDAHFSTSDNQISAASVWVSDLALVLRPHEGRLPDTGLVLDATSGEPIAGATLSFLDGTAQGVRDAAPPVQSDRDGLFPIPSRLRSAVVLAEYGDRRIGSTSHVYFPRHRIRREPSHTVFFTDRSVYRPGQTIDYKGIALHAGWRQRFTPYTHRTITVVLYDANRREIARATHRTNEYGSFHGSFTAPSGQLLGRMTIVALDPAPGGVAVRIEEYKRPKFEVTLDPPAAAVRLDGLATVTGKAVAYTGAAIGGARVKWRVERASRLPAWCSWYAGPADKAVAHGLARTAADGTFRLEFPAVPDRTIPAKNEPVFDFGIHVDVVDSNGETRSADLHLSVGYSALVASLDGADWLTNEKPVELHVAIASLDGEPRPASGRIAIRALVPPSAPVRKELSAWQPSPPDPSTDPANPLSWARGEIAATLPFATGASGRTLVSTPLRSGVYLAELETVDRFGRKVTAQTILRVLDPASPRCGLELPNVFAAPRWSVEPGQTFTALWGTGYDRGRALVELECNGRLLQRYWTSPERTQELVTVPVTEAMRGGFTVRVICVRENRAYFNERVVDVPWTDKKLLVHWGTFRSHLAPGARERWSLVVSGPDAPHASAEMVAALYDRSLDQIASHRWPEAFTVWRRESSAISPEFLNAPEQFLVRHTWTGPTTSPANRTYRRFPADLASLPYEPDEELVILTPFMVNSEADKGYRASQTLAGSRISTNDYDDASDAAAEPPAELMAPDTLPAASESAPPTPRTDQVTPRRNLNETAFFFPQLHTDADGTVHLDFTMPEALTTWKFLAFAHDRELRSGFLTDEIVTSKDLMVEPNPPRFVREGDAIEFAVKVTNLSTQPQSGTVRLTFADAATSHAADAALGNRTPEQAFDVPAKESRSYSWRIAVPDGQGFLTYKAVAASAKFSDGEEGYLPVLSRRIQVTESLPLPIRGPATKQFEFAKLLASGASPTLRSQSLTVQMVSQPAWYAVLALPYLMEFPHECSEQVFNRYYANALARHLANSDPKIRRVFELWKNTPALASPLEKNADLKSVLLEETPWLREAKSESEARHRLGVLFDSNRLDDESTRALHQLAERQLGDGLWSWFPGGSSSEYISLYIVAGFGRLRHLGVPTDIAPAVKALAGLDAWIARDYAEILQRPKPEDYTPDTTEALYLYARSFFLSDQPIDPKYRPAVDFLLRQAKKHWPELHWRQSQAHLALALQRFGDPATAQAIVHSLKERSVTDPELGMYWRNGDDTWWWYDAPIETQAMMIEAFDEVTHDAQAVEDCKVWLLKNKQTESWPTTKATADAIYALLLRGENLLASNALVQVSLGGTTLVPEKVEAGTGFYEQRVVGDAIEPAMGHIEVKKTDSGASWGSVHWQYLEDMTKITPHTGTPLTLHKSLWIKETTAQGPVLKPVTGPVAVGDELVVRLELRTDRAMEFVHLKDQRPSGVEPVDVLSGYRYQDGLSYYQSTKDTATHFFIDRLPAGTYVFEYSTRVQLRGRYQSGLAEIQCMYAPEFNSHSESFTLEVK